MLETRHKRLFPVPLLFGTWKSDFVKVKQQSFQLTRFVVSRVIFLELVPQINQNVNVFHTCGQKQVPIHQSLDERVWFGNEIASEVLVDFESFERNSWVGTFFVALCRLTATPLQTWTRDELLSRGDHRSSGICDTFLSALGYFFMASFLLFDEKKPLGVRFGGFLIKLRK